MNLVELGTTLPASEASSCPGKCRHTMTSFTLLHRRPPASQQNTEQWHTGGKQSAGRKEVDIERYNSGAPRNSVFMARSACPAANIAGSWPSQSGANWHSGAQSQQRQYTRKPPESPCIKL